jgi:heme-degrading monooxygenase HmoA
MMRSYALLLILVIGLILPPPSQAADRQTLYQLRTYQLHPQSKAVFHARFRDHAVAIMKRHGFDIAAIWEADHNGAPEFVYLLRWSDGAAMKAAWTGFMTDPEWIEIKRNTISPDAPIVGDIDSKTMRLTDYSPGLP